MARRLRSGYTTGACAAAAAKAAVTLLAQGRGVRQVEIPFPDGSRHGFTVKSVRELARPDGGRDTLASVIKDAGDDPDVTNGAEIVARAAFVRESPAPRCVAGSDPRIRICGGSGVGMVTKPGLAVRVGEPAINPVPRRMISEAVLEALARGKPAAEVEVTISVVDGEELAKKTLNQRLGIIGGLSILGTTGIVRPISAAAWTATIEASLNVAKEAGLGEVVLSTGRTSERAVQKLLDLPEEAYAMMGDYLAFSLTQAANRGFARIHLAGMWAKVLKAAMAIPQTHVRHGALEVADAVAFLRKNGVEEELLAALADANTAREIHARLARLGRREVIRMVCEKARRYAASLTNNIPVTLYLVTAEAKVEETVQ